MTLHVAKRIWSDEELLALPKDGYDHELIDGEIVMSPAGSEHGAIIMRIGGPLFTFVMAHKLGEVVDGQTGCRMATGDLLSPDVSFVINNRWKTHRANAETFFHGGPDLVVEVLSPDDTPTIVARKMELYFNNGTRLAWVVHPRKRAVDVYRSLEQRRTVNASASLDGEEIVPGFTLPLVNVFL